MKKYEALFILRSSLGEEALANALDQIGDTIVRQGGTVTDTQVLGTRTFARVMKKTRAGLYVKVLFDLEPDAVGPLQARYKLDENVFRVQVLNATPPKAVPEEVEAPEAVEATQ